MLMMITGCTKDFQLDKEASKSLYVIEGRISSMLGPYYVRVTKSAGLLDPMDNNGKRDSAEPVLDALVIISDDNGTIDTLIPAPTTVQRWRFVPTNNGWDSVYEPRPEYVTIHERGYYQTTKIKGVAGHTYRLRVEAGDQVFEASAYMPPVTPLDHFAIRDTMVPPYDTAFPTPIFYFRDPPGQKNYYMLKVQDDYEYNYDSYFASYGRTMNYSNLDYAIFDDKLLVPQGNAIPFYYTLMEENREVILYMFLGGGPYQGRLHSLTKEAYDYYNVFAKQLTYDGNVYKPAPTSPPGNISGALGLFFASDISAKLSQ